MSHIPAAAPPPAVSPFNPARRVLLALARDEDALVAAWARAMLNARDARDPGGRTNPPPPRRPAVGRRGPKMLT
jgi:hypothetical protein